MKILKKPECVVYDTENPNHFEFNPHPEGIYLNIYKFNISGIINNRDYFSIYFKSLYEVKHPIFNDFENSNFYVLMIEPKKRGLKWK
jgi:hypothetical protein